MNDIVKSSNSKRKADEESDFIHKRIKQEIPEPNQGENELTVEFEAFENGIKEEKEEEEQDVKIEPSENCYELAKFYISQMDHQALVAIVHKHIDTLCRLDHSRNRDNFQTELQNEHWKIEQFQGGLRKSDQ